MKLDMNDKQPVASLINSANNEKYHNLLKSMIKINEELTKNKLQLENCSDNIEKALYKMTHDLYSPLSNVEGLVNILKLNGCYEDENNKAIIDMIMDAVIKFKTRLKETANFNSILSSNTKKECGLLKDVLEIIKAKLSTTIINTNATIQADFGLENNSLCYESKYCILYNLLCHALRNKAADSNPHIFFKSYNENGLNVIEMEEDNSIINDDYLSIMELPDSADVSETINGLYIVNKIAEYAGGSLKVEELRDKRVAYKVFFK